MPFISPNGPTSLKISKSAPRGHLQEPPFCTPTGPHRYNNQVVLRGGVTWVGPVREHTLADWGDLRCHSTNTGVDNVVRNLELVESVRFYSVDPLFELDGGAQKGRKVVFLSKSGYFELFGKEFQPVTFRSSHDWFWKAALCRQFRSNIHISWALSFDMSIYRPKSQNMERFSDFLAQNGKIYLRILTVR